MTVDCLSVVAWKKITASYRFPAHDDVIKWKHFPRYCPFVREIHRSPVNSPHKGHWRGALMFSLICVWLNGWVNNREAGDVRRHRVHYDKAKILWQSGLYSHRQLAFTFAILTGLGTYIDILLVPGDVSQYHVRYMSPTCKYGVDN